MRSTRVASSTEMSSRTVVATNNNNCRETSVARAASGSLDTNHKALKAENFPSTNSGFAHSPQRGGGQSKQVRRSGISDNCGKPGHYARECRSAHKQNGAQQNDPPNNNGNKTKQFDHKVLAIAEDNNAVVNENTEEEAV